jgi:hypothetical protein
MRCGVVWESIIHFMKLSERVFYLSDDGVLMDRKGTYRR